MNRYKFLIKPLFYISSLLFSSWVVLKIEKLNPSDFGKYKAMFGSESRVPPVTNYNKNALFKLCSNYKAGKIDSTQLDQQLQQFLDYVQAIQKNETKKIDLQKTQK